MCSILLPPSDGDTVCVSVFLYSILLPPSGGDTVCVSVFLYLILLLPSGGDTRIAFLIADAFCASIFNTVAA